MLRSLSGQAGNLPEGLRKDKFKDCKSGLEYIIAKDSILIFKCVDCNKNYDKEFDKNESKRFGITYKFCNRDIIKFCLIKKVFIRMSTWTVSKDSMKRHC